MQELKLNLARHICEVLSDIRSGSKNAAELQTRMADQNTAEIPPWLQLGRLQQRIGAVVSMH